MTWDGETVRERALRSDARREGWIDGFVVGVCFAGAVALIGMWIASGLGIGAVL